MVFSARSARLLRRLLLGTCAFPLLQACGRSELEDDLSNSDGTISGGAGSSTGAHSSSGGGARNTTGGGNGRSGASTGGGTPNTAGGAGVITGGASTPGGRPPFAGSSVGGMGAGGTGRAGAGQGGSGVGGTAEAGTSTGGLVGNPITCGSVVCDSSTESCCVGLAGPQCTKQSETCAGAVLGCTLNSDCPDTNVCCISITGDLDAASSCKSRCDDSGTSRDRQLCQTAAECVMPFRYCTPTIFGFSVCTRRP